MIEFNREKDWIWDRYWQADRVAACLDEQSVNYNTAIASEWRSFFESLPVEASILDICTGNGAVALMAKDTASKTGQKFDVHGIDRAEINPAHFIESDLVGLDEITFRGRTDVNDMPFGDGQFTAVTSQYGLEYTEIDRSVPEIARVLTAGGKTRFVIHAAEGGVTQNARFELDEIERFLKETRILLRTRKAVELTWKAERGVLKKSLLVRAEKADAKFHEAMQKGKSSKKSIGQLVFWDKVLESVQHIYQVRHANELDALMSEIDAVETELAAYRGRLEALVGASKDPDERARLIDLFSDNGITCSQSSSNNEQGEFLGAVIEGTKAQ